MYAIIDIETTGGSPKHEKITEIAIYMHDGTQITDEYCTLINPEKYIPPYISSLTGITNEMVENSPRFFEVARKIVEMTNDCFFVAHNVSFDYNFVKSEFQQLGYDFQRQTLCTLKLSRKIIPGLKSYSLGNLCRSLNITIESRHRAAGDALATAKLFELLKSKDISPEQKIPFTSLREGRFKNLNGYINPTDIDRLPEKTGIYYFHDSEGNLIYIGKSNNIYKRTLAHFSSVNGRRSLEMKSRIAGISFELTGSELIALLKESVEIKKHKPLYNRAQRREFFAWGLYSFHDKNGYINFRIKKVSQEVRAPITGYTSRAEANKELSALTGRYWLCQKLCGLYDTEGACFHYEIRQCNGACFEKEPVKVYNSRAQKLIDYFTFESENFIIIDTGRNITEKSVICIENGVYRGFGYINTEDSYLHISDIISCIISASENRDSKSIIKAWLKKNKPEKIIRF